MQRRVLLTPSYVREPWGRAALTLGSFLLPQHHLFPRCLLFPMREAQETRRLRSWQPGTRWAEEPSAFPQGLLLLIECDPSLIPSVNLTWNFFSIVDPSLGTDSLQRSGPHINHLPIFPAPPANTVLSSSLVLWWAFIRCERVVKRNP